MIKRCTLWLTGLTLVLIGLYPVASVACTFHDTGNLQNSFHEFRLPSVGEYEANVISIYGEPSRRLQGANGMSIWDYGSFQVMLKNKRVTYAAMW